MKKKFLLIGTVSFLILTAGCLIYLPDEQVEPGRDRPYGMDRDITYFYDYLSSYGAWIDYPSFGYVWIPRNVHRNWRPYTRGRWVFTDHGWTWISQEAWGWIPYHYGRWGYDRGIGWFWVPDVVWAPAWVTWRTDGFYIGWAPLPPDAVFRPGSPFNPYSFGTPSHYWIFVEGRLFWSDRLDRYVLPWERNITIIHRTKLLADIRESSGRIVNRGLDPDEIGKWTRREVRRYELRDSNRQGSARVEGCDVFVYKPPVKKDGKVHPISIHRREDIEEERFAVDPDILRREQDKERAVLEESQKREMEDVRKDINREMESTGNADERKKIENGSKARLQEMKKNHDDEKTEMNERHKAEGQKAGKAKLRKKSN